MPPQHRRHSETSALSSSGNMGEDDDALCDMDAGGGAIAGGGGGSRRKRKKSRSQGSGTKGCNTITIGLPMFGHSVHRSDAQNVPRNRANSVSSIASGGSSGGAGGGGGNGGGFSSAGSSPDAAAPGGAHCQSAHGDISASNSPSSNDGFQPPRRVLMQDRSR